MPDADYADADELDEEPIEAYCVSCKLHVEIEHPTAIWTRRGTPGTRGECPNCGSTVFRMGRTERHMQRNAPEAGQMIGDKKMAPALKKPGRPRYAAFINHAPEDREFAERLAEDLSKTGIPAWYDPDVAERNTKEWATGVHPGLQECSHMVVVLSPAALNSEAVEKSWQFFRDKRKPLAIAQVAAAEPPDALRRQPRFDFAEDYRAAFRNLVQALGG
jgi:hypothetical protein